MEKTSVMVSVICPKEIFESDYYFLAYNFPVVNADSIEVALRSGIFFYADVMIFDCSDQEASYRDLLSKVDERNPGIRIIASWNCKALADSQTVSRLFYCFKKPISEKDIVRIIEAAVDADHTHEKRREPRIPAEFEVEFFRPEGSIRGNTVNVSLNGMQTVVDSGDIDGELSSCRVYFGAGRGGMQFADLALDQKYFRPAPESGQHKLGFSFSGIDLNLKKELYRIFTV